MELVAGAEYNLCFGVKGYLFDAPHADFAGARASPILVTGRNPSLPDGSGAPDMDLDLDSLCLKDVVGGIHQLKTPELSLHWMPMPWTNNSPVAPDSDSLASSVVKGSRRGCGSDGVRKGTRYSDVVCFVLCFVL